MTQQQLDAIQRALVELDKSGADVRLAPLYGSLMNSVSIIIDGVDIVDGRLTVREVTK
jgi:hypothetical protein